MISDVIRKQLRALVVGVLDAKLESNMSADMILDMVGRVTSANGETPGTSPGANGKEEDGRRRPRIQVPPLRRALADDEEYTVADAAEILGMKEGTFRAFYARPGNIEITRKPAATKGGRERVAFTGKAIKESHAKRYAAKA